MKKKKGTILHMVQIACWGLDPLKWPLMWPLNMPLLSPHLRQPYKNTLADSALKDQALISQFITTKNPCYILQCQYPQTGGLDPPHQGALFIIKTPLLGHIIIIIIKYLLQHLILVPQFNFRAFDIVLNQAKPFVFQAKNEDTIFSTLLEKYLLQIILMSSSPLSSVVILL